MELKNFLVILTLTIILEPVVVQGANILFYFAVSGYSHRISAWPIIEKLANSGHSVTFLSPYPPKIPQPHPNITDYVPDNLAKDLGVIDLDFIGLRIREGVSAIDNLWNVYDKMGIGVCDALMKKQEYLKWINKSQFDVVVINALHNDCAYGLVHKFKAKIIMYAPTSQMMWFKDAYGYADENLPEIQYHPPKNMTFLQSVQNEFSSLLWQYRRYTETWPKVEAILKKGLNDPDLPPLHEIEKNTSIVFTYTHPSEEFSRSLPPNVVEIGGIHCNDDRKPLPKDLDEFINSGDEGFVLLSFGTYAAISSLPVHVQNIFFDAISKVPNVKFLVKFNGDPPTNFPMNAKAVQWIPQQDVIAHPKIRAFIGHGGLLGTQEAVWHGVPMIVIPLFAEQDYQAVRAHGRGTAIALELAELTEEILFNAISQVLSNTKYKQNTLRLSKLFRDRPWKPLDAAVWWIEYVLRYDDLQHLRPIGVNRTWYERRMLHIWGFIVICILTVFALTTFLIFFIIKSLIRISFPTKPKLE